MVTDPIPFMPARAYAREHAHERRRVDVRTRKHASIYVHAHVSARECARARACIDMDTDTHARNNTHTHACAWSVLGCPGLSKPLPGQPWSVPDCPGQSCGDLVFCFVLVGLTRSRNPELSWSVWSDPALSWIPVCPSFSPADLIRLQPRRTELGAAGRPHHRQASPI